MTQSPSKPPRKYVKITPVPFGNYSADQGPEVSYRLDLADLPLNKKASKRGRSNLPEWVTDIQRYEDKTIVHFLAAMNGYDYKVIDSSVGPRHSYPAIDFADTCRKVERKGRDKKLLGRIENIGPLPDDDRSLKFGSKGLQNSYGLDDKYVLNDTIIADVHGYQKCFSEVVADQSVFESGYRRVSTASSLLLHANKLFSFGVSISPKRKRTDIRLSPEDTEYFYNDLINSESFSGFGDILVATLSSGINFSDYVFGLANLWDIFEFCAFLGREKIQETTDLDMKNLSIYTRYHSSVYSLKDFDRRFQWRARLIDISLHFLWGMDAINSGISNDRKSLDWFKIDIADLNRHLFPRENQVEYWPHRISWEFMEQLRRAK